MQNIQQKNIVIAGAGFGGIRCALDSHKYLKKYRLLNSYKIILIDKNRLHIYQPNLYEAASLVSEDCCNSELINASVAIDTSDIIGEKRIEFVNDRVIDIDIQNKIVKTDDQSIEYEYLILALGSETNYFNIPGAQEHGFPLKTLTDALELRSQVDMLMSSPETSKLNVVIGGGGLTGVELAGELAHAFKKLIKLYKRGDGFSINITLVEAGPTILGGLPEQIVQKAREKLKKYGTKILENAKIQSIEKGYVALGKENETQNIDYSIFVWTAGVKPNVLLEKTFLKKNQKGCIVVNKYLQANKNIYVIGDIAFCEDPDIKKPPPGTAYIAIKEGRIAAKNIIAAILNQKPRAFTPPTSYPFVVPIGGKFAIAHFKGITMAGYLGWIIKLFIELKYLLGILPPYEAVKKWVKTIQIVIKND